MVTISELLDLLDCMFSRLRHVRFIGRTGRGHARTGCIDGSTPTRRRPHRHDDQDLDDQDLDDQDLDDQSLEPRA